MTTQPRHRAVAMAAALAIPLVLAGCRGGTAPVGDGGERAPDPRPSASISVGAGAGGPGSITLTMTEPASVSGHVATPVACLTGRVYEASASSAVVQDYQVSFSVRVAGYTGPGQYQTVISVTVVEPDGTSITVPAVPGVPAQITATGGTFSVTGTGSNGRTVALALTWACSA